MQVNSAPRMVHDVISADEAAVWCKATACAIFCLPCCLGILCYVSCCSDEGELRKMDKRKIKHIKAEIEQMTVSEADLAGLNEEKKIAKIREQILAVRRVANEFDSLQSSGQKSAYKNASERINTLLDEMIEGDDTLKKDKEALGVKKKEEDVLSFLNLNLKS